MTQVMYQLITRTDQRTQIHTETLERLCHEIH